MAISARRVFDGQRIVPGAATGVCTADALASATSLAATACGVSDRKGRRDEHSAERRQFTGQRSHGHEE